MRRVEPVSRVLAWAAIALVVVASHVLAGGFSAKVGRIDDVPPPVIVVPGALVEFWVSPEGILTRYDAALGERISVVPVQYMTGNQLASTSRSNSKWGGQSMLQDTSYGGGAGYQEGLPIPRDAYLDNFLWTRTDTLGGPAFVCTVEVRVIDQSGDSLRALSRDPNVGQALMKQLPDSVFAQTVEAGDRLCVSHGSAVNIEDPQILFDLFWRYTPGDTL